MFKPFCDVCGSPMKEREGQRRAWNVDSHTSDREAWEKIQTAYEQGTARFK